MGRVPSTAIDETRTAEPSYIRSLCGDPEPYKTGPYVLRAFTSVLLALPIVYLTMAAADKGHLPMALIYVLSPGFIIEMRMMFPTFSVIDVLRPFEVAILLNMAYWSSLLFELLSMIGSRKSSGTQI